MRESGQKKIYFLFPENQQQSNAGAGQKKNMFVFGNAWTKAYHRRIQSILWSNAHAHINGRKT